MSQRLAALAWCSRMYLVDAAAGDHVAAGQQRHQPAGHGSRSPSPAHDKACEAISLRRHCPDQVLGVAVRLSPDDLSAFPADHHRGCNHPGRLRGMAPSLNGAHP